MKTPIWESSPGATMALLFPTTPHTDRAFARFDLYTLTLPGGPVLRYTTADFDITYGGNTWSSKSVRIDTEGSRPIAHWKIGLDVDTWQVVFFPRIVDDLTGALYPDLIGGVPWLPAVRAGALDAAITAVDRCYFALPLPAPSAQPQTPVGAFRIFAGRVAEVDAGRTAAVINLNSHLELLNVNMPRNLFQAPCRHRLFDQGCTLNAALYARNVSLLAITGAGSLSAAFATVSIPASGTLALGRIVFTSGQNAGFSRTIRQYNPTHAVGQASVEFIAPAPFAIANGDTATVYPGCDKTMATCTAFSNLANFGGDPFIPAPELSA